MSPLVNRLTKKRQQKVDDTKERPLPVIMFTTYRHKTVDIFLRGEEKIQITSKRCKEIGFSKEGAEAVKIRRQKKCHHVPPH